MITKNDHACFAVAFGVGLFASLVVGCGSEAAKKAVNAAKGAVNKVASSVASQMEEVERPGESIMELTINDNADKPLLLKNALARFEALENRPTVLKIETTGYGEAQYPAFYMHALSTEREMSAFDGKTIDALVYFQKSSFELPYYTPRDKPAKVKITKLDPFYISAVLESTELIDATEQDVRTVKGNLVVLIPQEKKAPEKKAPPAAAKASTP